MRIRLLIVLFVFSFLNVNSQILDIPDANFKAVLLEADVTNSIAGDSNGNNIKIDSNNDGEIQLSEAQAVYELTVINADIQSLDGIGNFTQLTYLNCGGNNLSELDVSSNMNLLYLNCSGTYISQLDLSANVNLEILFALECSISTVNLTNNVNLRGFHLGYNNLQSIDISQNLQLESIFLNGNNITNFELPQNIDLLDCNLAGLPLESLDLSAYPNLRYLNCDTTGLTALDVINNPLLEYLSFTGNQIASIDVSQNPLLWYFAGGFNNLSSIDVSSNLLLRDLHVHFNQISTLNVSQNLNLEILNAIDNNLEALDLNSNTNLRILRVQGNEIEELDLSNNPQLEYLNAADNPMTFLNIKNGTVFESALDYYLEATPLSFICADDEELEDIIGIINENTVVNSYCSFAPGGDSFTIEGENKIDTNINGCDVDDLVYPYLKFSINDGITVATFISNSIGNYTIPLPEGSYSISPLLANPEYFLVSPDNISVSFPEDTSPYNQDFCITPNGVHNDLEILIIPLTNAAPGFDSDYKIVYKNVGNTIMSGEVTFDYSFDSDYMEYVYSSPSETSNINNVLSWDYMDLEPLETREILVAFTLNTPTDDNFPLNSEDELNFEASIYPITDDDTPDNNSFSLNQTVVNSYDPNDIRCLEGETIVPERVGEFVHYKIRFENVGTANAVNIVVKNKIDATTFDINSLVPLNGSHDFFTRINAENDVEFIFENINLPFDDANNDGYVIYKIKTLESLVLGDTFSNQAEIYFDYNAPIITNLYTTEIAEEDLIDTESNTIDVNVYPSPVSDIITIEGSDVMESISLVDTNGRIILNSLIGNRIKHLDVSMLDSGMYFLRVFSNAGNTTLKIVKK
ncbi:DUF7619 domain-containing protein [Psychroserpens algicola]|uniref:T9SS type A sorting domain-containing protein n=1 Tax=Psychroserpens algicola TaxID=1719034 RepID=A0ABT0HCX8_9FLAO|nr:T9SS type A sorting domain-containing protein [Psychroserpens algicola]MCK8482037.1 T9SS type A sorting domain-containing protein [Psychroserpens algicola]